MLPILTHQFFFFKKKEIWFYNNEPLEEGSYTTYCYSLTHLKRKFEHELIEHTSLINLTRTEEQLFNSISTTFQYDIRQAQKLSLEYKYDFNPSIEVCKNVIYSFNKFAKTKNISFINKRRVFALQKTNNIVISKMTENDNEICTHVYLFDEQRILLMHSFHNIDFINEKTRGYANKYLHWKDILLFKERHFETYNFGGINKEKVPGISNFKLNFGGEISEVNNYIRVTAIFKPLYKLYKLIR